MKKFIKIIVIFAIIVAAVLVIASIALRIYLPPEKAKKLVLEKLSSQLHREVKLGDVSVGILTGLQMTNLKISEAPTFAKGVFVSSQKFSLKVALTPLLFKKVIIREVSLERPEVNIIRNADGKTFNFSDLTNAPSKPPSPPVGEGRDGGNPPPSSSPASGEDKRMPFLLLVSRADIENGALHFMDHSPAKQSIDIAPFDLLLKNVSLTTPFNISTSMHVKSKGSDLAITFSGDVDLLSGTFKIKQGSLISQDSKIVLSGELNHLKSAAPAADLKIDIPQLTPSNFSAFFAMPPGVRIDGALTGHASLVGDQKSMTLDVLLDAAKTKIQYANSFSKPEKVAMSLSAQGVLKDLSTMDFQSLLFVLGSMTLTGKGQVHNVQSAQPAFNFHFESNSFSLPDLLQYAPGSVPPGIVLAGNNKLSADLSGTPANIQFAAKWDGTDLSIKKEDQFSKPVGMPFDAAAFGNSIAPGQILIKNLGVKLGPNQMMGAGTYFTKGTQSSVNFTAKGSNWSVQELAKVSPLLAPYHPTGTLSFDAHATGPTSALQTSVQTSADVAMADIKQENYEGKNLTLKWNLAQVTPDLSKMTGSASLKQGPGAITNVQKLAASSKMGRILLGPLDALAKIQDKGLLKGVNLPSLQTITFSSIVGDYLFHPGVMDIKAFDLTGQAVSIADQGTVGLTGAQTLNMTVVMKLAAGSIGGTVGAIVDKDDTGRPMFKFFVTGPAAAPQVKLDTQEIGKKAVQQVGQELLKNPNVQNAVDDLQKSLKGLFH